MASVEAMPSAAKPRKPTAEELELIKSDLSSFASSLGFFSSSSAIGFDDSDFRKTGPLKPPKHSDKTPKTQPKAKLHPLQIDPFHDTDEKTINRPNLPLMKATSLSGHWYVDAEELERRVLGAEAKKTTSMGFEEMKDLVEKKKGLAERLLDQYTRDCEVTRRKSGDMRLLETTARSGTSVDKISAFTCLVEDNPMASMRALDALLCKSVEFLFFLLVWEVFVCRLVELILN